MTELKDEYNPFVYLFDLYKTHMKAIVMETIIPAWYDKGRVALIVNTTAWKETKIEDIIEKVISYENRLIYFILNIQENTRVKELAEILVGRWKRVVVMTDSLDDISPLRMTRWLNFVIQTVAPNSKSNQINFQTFGLLNEWDSIYFSAKNETDLAEIKEFIASKSLIRPTIVISIPLEWEAKDKLSDKVIGLWLVWFNLLVQ